MSGEGFAFFRWQTMNYSHLPFRFSNGGSCCMNQWRGGDR